MINRVVNLLVRLWMVVVLVLCLGSMLIMPVLAQDAPVTFTELTAATRPWDAATSPDGSMIYYTAISSSGIPSVYSVPAAGGEAVVLTEAKSLVMPLGIAVSTDGSTLYVTDPWAAGSEGNAIYAVSTTPGNDLTVIAGTQGTTPQGIAVIQQDGVDQLYFTGIDPTTGLPAVYQIAASEGARPVLLASGTPLIAPAGIAAASDGTVYVLDRLASGSGMGSVLRITSGKIETIASNIRTGGQMPGLALTLNEALLLVSSLETTQGTAQVLVINLADLTTSIVNDVIGENMGAGGLHRAYLKDEYAWADSPAYPSGKIYRVVLNP